jgi:hypothetical protein
VHQFILPYKATVAVRKQRKNMQRKQDPKTHRCVDNSWWLCGDFWRVFEVAKVGEWLRKGTSSLAALLPGRDLDTETIQTAFLAFVGLSACSLSNCKTGRFLSLSVDEYHRV